MNTYVIDFAGGHRGQRVVNAANPAAAELAAVKWNGGRVVSTRHLPGDWQPSHDGGAERIVKSAHTSGGWHIVLLERRLTWKAGDPTSWSVVRQNSDGIGAVLLRTDREDVARQHANREWAADVAATRPFTPEPA